MKKKKYLKNQTKQTNNRVELWGTCEDPPNISLQLKEIVIRKSASR